MFNVDVCDDRKNVLFGVMSDQSTEINFCVLIAKMYIHNVRCRSRDCDDLYFSFTSFLSELKENLLLEREIACEKNRIEAFNVRYPNLMDNI